MKKVLYWVTRVFPNANTFNMTILMFRVAVSIELIVAHGLKKLGVGSAGVEQVPNPLHLPGALNTAFADAANLFFPVLVIFGLFTRLAILPILAVTLTG